MRGMLGRHLLRWFGCACLVGLVCAPAALGSRISYGVAPGTGYTGPVVSVAIEVGGRTLTLVRPAEPIRAAA